MAPLQPQSKKSTASQGDLLQIQHFTHHHLLQKLFTASDFNCNGCNSRGKGIRYRCSACNFDLHEQCATAPHHLSTHLHPQHQLNLVNRPGKSHFCDVCKGFADGLSYTCSLNCGFDVHPLCAQIPVATGVPPATCQQQGGVTWGRPCGGYPGVDNNNNRPVVINHHQQQQQGVPTTAYGGYHGVNNSQPVMVNHREQQQQQGIPTTALGGYNGVNNNIKPPVMMNQQQQQGVLPTTSFGGYQGVNNSQPVMMNHQQQQGVPTTSYGGYNNSHPVMVNQQQQMMVPVNNSQLMMVNHQQQQGIATAAYGGYPGVVNNNQPMMMMMMNQQQQQPPRSNSLTKVGKIAANVLMTTLIGVPINFNSKN